MFPIWKQYSLESNSVNTGFFLILTGEKSWLSITHMEFYCPRQPWKSTPAECLKKKIFTCWYMRLSTRVQSLVTILRSVAVDGDMLYHTELNYLNISVWDIMLPAPILSSHCSVDSNSVGYHPMGLLQNFWGSKGHFHFCLMKFCVYCIPILFIFV